MQLRLHEVALDAITEMVSVIGEDQIYRMVNAAWCRAMGLRAEQVAGRHVRDVFPGGVGSEREVALAECLRTGTPHTVRAPLDAPRLEGRQFEAIYSFFGLDAQGVRCVVVVTRDITAESETLWRIRQAEAETRELLEAFPGSIAVLDEQLVYTFANPRMAELLRTTAAGLIGKSVFEFWGQQRGETIAALCRRALAGEALSYERVHAGRTVEVTLCSGINSRTGRPQYYGFGQDISQRKAAEQALITARDEAEHANQAKSLFLSHMSHELRTPLNAILGFAQVLAADAALPLAAPQRGAVHQIERSGRHLLQLINDVLDLQRIEAGRLEVTLAPMTLAPLVQECLALVAPLALEHEVSLHALAWPQPAPQVMADALRLKQVLLNLLGNAIKHNHAGGQVQLLAERHAQHLRLSVADSGSGLSAAEQARLFTPFEPLLAASGTLEGAGIGLALSRKLMQAMGGDIGVHSEIGRGSRFWIELPLAAQAHGDGASADAATTAVGPTAAPLRHALYIEDNAVNIVLIEAMLARVPGLKLHSELQPVAGLASAMREPPDVILLDIQLPVMSGYEVLKRLRAAPQTRHIPVIAVSANAMPSDVVKGLAAGFAQYITKPVELACLLAAVHDALATVTTSEDDARETLT